MKRVYILDEEKRSNDLNILRCSMQVGLWAGIAVLKKQLMNLGKGLFVFHTFVYAYSSSFAIALLGTSLT